jgi:hypothetical protein
MSEAFTLKDAEDLVQREFRQAGVRVLETVVREYPEETILIVKVPESVIAEGAAVGNQLDRILNEHDFAGFVTVRGQPVISDEKSIGRLKEGVRDTRANEFARVLTERSRTSEVQPSLSYVKDAAANISTVQAGRHQLIFGRRGAGKTALMLEAKQLIEEREDVTAWLNVQTHRRESLGRIYLWVLDSVLDALRSAAKRDGERGRATDLILDLAARVDALLSDPDVSTDDVSHLVPFAQRSIRRFLQSGGCRLFVFLDDFHYVDRNNQPEVLDLLHATVRDADAWLKIASIRHLTTWYKPSPQMGLQTGQDAALIDLDVTLQDPSRAKSFLEEVLSRYATHVGIPALWQVFHPQALDRLVLASGAVPRDYLVLAAAAIQKARSRPKARQVGGQDVNNAAGEAAQAKIRELEEDLSGSGRFSDVTLGAFQEVRRFCLEQTTWTYFRIDFKDKERRADEYALLQSVVDLRLVHLINPSVSHESRAGERFEVLMLDLSQYTGQRLKKNIQVLDFVGGHFVSKRTGRRGSALIGNTPKRLIQILRRPPVLALDSFSTMLASTSDEEPTLVEPQPT